MVLDTLFSLLESVPYGFCAMSLDQNIVFWNRTAEHFWGFPLEKSWAKGAATRQQALARAV